MFRVETYIICTPHGGDGANGDGIMYNRSFFFAIGKHCKYR